MPSSSRGRAVARRTAATPRAAAGDQPEAAATGGGEGSGSAASTISPSTGERLQGLGADGAATQALAESNAPRIRENGDGQAAKGSDGSQGGQSGAGGALDALLGSDDGGMGIGLPLILLAVAAGGVLFVVRRRAGHAS